MTKKPRKRKPRFFCDGCGAEVSATSKKCPRCGKFFASMLCPRCGFCGEHDAFVNGCPACGYAASSLGPVSGQAAADAAASAAPTAADPPQWAYIVCIAILVLFMAALMTYILR
jgi:hypothetical protein